MSLDCHAIVKRGSPIAPSVFGQWRPVLFVGLAAFLAGCMEEESMPDPAAGAPKTLTVTSTGYAHGTRIPDKYTCEGADVSPPVEIKGIPPNAKTWALIMDDPDAPRGTWTHWTVWSLPANLTKLPEAANIRTLGGREGMTDSGRAQYHGPCPPPGTHRYFLKAYALNASLDLPSGAALRDLTKALTGKVLAWGELMGTYSRN